MPLRIRLFFLTGILSSALLFLLVFDLEMILIARIDFGLGITTTLTPSHNNIHATSLCATGSEHLPLLTAITCILRVHESALGLVLVVGSAGTETAAGDSLGFFCVGFVLGGVLALGAKHLERVAPMVASC